MKKNWFSIVGIILVVVGAVLSYFAKFPLSDVTGFAVTMFGAGISAASFWNKREKTSVFSVLTIVLLGIGAFLLGFGGFAESTMTTIITSVIGIVAVIAGIISGVVNTLPPKEAAEQLNTRHEGLSDGQPFLLEMGRENPLPLGRGTSMEEYRNWHYWFLHMGKMTTRWKFQNPLPGQKGGFPNYFSMNSISTR